MAVLGEARGCGRSPGELRRYSADFRRKTEVILVQVNPGEAFTIQREDGQFQCITGPAQVPMMSPNGAVPPIYVPTGYVSQVIEENGVRRVLVIPQPEFHPGGHTHLTAFLPHPAMAPPPHHVYGGLGGGPGDPGSPYIHQYHAAYVFPEPDSRPPHGWLPFTPREERACKTYERLQKRLRERQGGGPGSPPPSPRKGGRAPTTGGLHYNGTGGEWTEQEVGQEGVTEPGRGTPADKTKRSPCTAKEPEELDEESRVLQEQLSSISKPAVTEVQARKAWLVWGAPKAKEVTEGSVGEGKSHLNDLSYEVTVSCSGQDGKYETAYSGDELTAALEGLKPATDYHARVQARCHRLQGNPSETVCFTTLSCEPDTPAAPRKTSRTKNSLVLQWEAPCDNGSKIQSYVLQWDQGQGTGAFQQCYCGPQKQYRLTKLLPASKYSFRLAAENDMGLSSFSETVDLFTSGSVPMPPAGLELVDAGISWLSLRWQRPDGSPSGDDIFYILEMEEEDSGYGFKSRYDGGEMSCTVRDLQRSTKYLFRVAAYNTEGKSDPGPLLEFSTRPDRPGCLGRPVLRGKVHPGSFRISWEAPKDDGGSEVTEYVVEMSQGFSGTSWQLVYSGSAQEYLFEGLRPGTSYQSRVYCISEGGQSLPSEILQIQTPAVPPGPCAPPRVVGKPKAREVQLRWGPPLEDGGAMVSCYSLELGGARGEECGEVYQGPEIDCTVSGLLPGRAYTFRLRATNQAGYGPLSERCEVTTGAGAPEPCRAPHVVCRSPTCAVVTWETPPSNGAPVIEFRAEWGLAQSSMQVCYCGAALSHEVKGLQPATSYYCRIQAVNAAGAGPFSETVISQTPCSVPAAVSGIQEAEPQWAVDEERDGVPSPDHLHCPTSCLALCWEPPCDHGSQITGYFIDLGERQPIAVGPVTRYVIRNLQPDTSFRIRIQALNSLGVGPFSHTVKVKTRPLPPPPPRLECTAFSHQTLRLKWGEGSSKGGPSESLQYQLQMQDKNERFMSLYRGPCHTHKVQRLMESTSYTFRIQAFNEAGEGPFSELYTFATPRAPPAPLKAPRIERLSDHTCEVSWEAVPPMKGDPIVYTLQCMMGNTTFKQVYKGSATSFQAAGLQPTTEYRFRACAVRQSQTAPELTGPYSTTVVLLPCRGDTPTGVGGARGAGAGAGRAQGHLTDEQCAALLLALFAVLSILIAFVIQYFVIK